MLKSWRVYGTDFGLTISTGVFYVALACVCLNKPYPLCAFKKGVHRDKQREIIPYNAYFL